jgi:hypothetical protein
MRRRRLIAVMKKKGSSIEVIPMHIHGQVSIVEINPSSFVFVRMSMSDLTLALPCLDGIYKQKYKLPIVDTNNVYSSLLRAVSKKKILLY